MMTNRLEAKEVAKLVRKKLTDVFGKKTKFSVICRDGNCINVRWDNGPTRKEVEKHISHFCAGQFESIDDSYNYTPGGKYDNRYLFTDRHISHEVWAKVRDIMIAQFPQMGEEGFFNLDSGRWCPYNPRIQGIDWDRLYRQAVWHYDAQTGQFIVTDLLNGYHPDNWQHAK